MEVHVRRALITMVCGMGLWPALASAQSELQLRQAFEGRYVIVRMDMPATHRGVDLYPEREPAVDFQSYSARLREFGVALREGDRVMVTAVRVKKKNIEFQLGGGGYGVFGDDSGSVYVPTESKSRREKDLEKYIKDERDPDRRRRGACRRSRRACAIRARASPIRDRGSRARGRAADRRARAACAADDRDRARP